MQAVLKGTQGGALNFESGELLLKSSFTFLCLTLSKLLNLSELQYLCIQDEKHPASQML